MFDAHLEDRRMAEAAEDCPTAGAGFHRHIGRPPRADAFLGGDGAINRFRRCGDADAMDEVGRHDAFSHRLNTDEIRMKSAK